MGCTDIANHFSSKKANGDIMMMMFMLFAEE